MGEVRDVRVWRFDVPQLCISSAPVGGGIGLRSWIINAQVPLDYARTDLDDHVRELASAHGCEGDGVGMLTAANVRNASIADEEGIEVYATVGVTLPTWAAAADDVATAWRPGTVNVVALGSGTSVGRRARERGNDGDRGQGPGALRNRRAGHGHRERRRLHRVRAARRRRAVWRPALARRRAAGPGGPRGGAALGAAVITLVLGGTRSGKSEVAERLAAATGDSVTVLATAAPCDDADFARRIDAHRARRPPEWTTIEEPHDIAGVLTRVDGTVVVDALGTWIANAAEFAVDVPGLCNALGRRTSATIVVSDEVGLSVHPPTHAGRRFADAVGLCNRAVAEISDRVLLVVAGRALELRELDGS